MVEGNVFLSFRGIHLRSGRINVEVPQLPQNGASPLQPALFQKPWSMKGFRGTCTVE